MREQAALMAKKLATTMTDPSSLKSYIACRLTLLDKCPGLRPIGIGEILHRTIEMAIGWVLKCDIQEAAGPIMQVCSGLKGGAEEAIHSMKELFGMKENGAVILADASSTFNCLNKKVALHNIKYTCPPLAIILINTYRQPARLFISGGAELLSQEGTTQGDNLAMPFYTLGTISLLNKLHQLVRHVKQVWLADDATGCGKLIDLVEWWKLICEEGRRIGYFVKESKSWLILKDPQLLDEAMGSFASSNINITTEGKRHLGVALGNSSFCMNTSNLKWTTGAEKWRSYVNLPNLSYTQHPMHIYMDSSISLHTYFLLTLPNIGKHLKPLDDIINEKLIPTFLGSVHHQLNETSSPFP